MTKTQKTENISPMLHPERSLEKSKEEWDFRFGPVKIIGDYDLASFADHKAKAEKVLADYLVQAVEASSHFLNRSVALAQFICVPPTRLEHEPHIALDTPAVFQSDLSDYAKGFSIPAHFSQLKTDGYSFHNRVNQHLHCPASTLLVFTTDQDPPERHPFGGVNVIWVKIKTTIVASPWIEDIQLRTMKPLPGKEHLSSVHIKEVIADQSNQKIFAQANPLPNPSYGYKLYFKEGLSPGSRKAFEEFVEKGEQKLIDDAYLAHVAPCVAFGPVVLAVPKKLFFDEPRQNQQVDNSGVTVMFRANTELRYEELEYCYRLGYRLSTTYSDLYGIGQAFQIKLGKELEQARVLGLEAAAHVLLGPVDMWAKWLDSVSPEALGDKYVKRAKAALKQASYNAETVLLLARLRSLRANRDKLELTEIDIEACVTAAFHDIVESYMLFYPSLKIKVSSASGDLTAYSNDRLLRVAISELTRNACEEVTLKLEPTRRRKVADIELGVERVSTAAYALIWIENSWPNPDAARIDELNKRLSSGGLLEGVRKGSNHFGVGTDTFGCIVKEFLKATPRFILTTKGRFRCELLLPQIPDTAIIL